MSGLEPTTIEIEGVPAPDLLSAQGAPAAPVPAAPPEVAAKKAPAAKADPVPDANGVITLDDANGRAIGVKKLTLLQRFDITILLGQNASNGPALNLALMASAVVSIGGREVKPPLNQAQLRARMQELDFAGIDTVSKAFEVFNPLPDEGDEASDEDGVDPVKVALKNS